MNTEIDKLDVLLVEDEDYTRDMMIEYIHRRKELNLLDTVNNGCRAAELLQKKQYSVIFLDIQLPCMNGFEILETIKNPPYVIFSTVHTEYALKAINFGAVDYIVKPVSLSRFHKAVDRTIAFYSFMKEKNSEATIERDLIDILQNDYELSYQEAIICSLFFSGSTRNQITELLQIKTSTLKNHLRSIYFKTIYRAGYVPQDEEQRKEKLSYLIRFMHSVI